MTTFAQLYPYVILFLFFMFAHALADYPLQNDFLAKAKNRNTPIPGMPWWICLGWHAAIHAGFVLLLTGSALLFLIELVAHWVIDDLKCRQEINFEQDQFFHIVCKGIYIALLLQFPALTFHSPVLYFFK